jgi:hypothetical protein
MYQQKPKLKPSIAKSDEAKEVETDNDAYSKWKQLY